MRQEQCLLLQIGTLDDAVTNLTQHRAHCPPTVSLILKVFTEPKCLAWLRLIVAVLEKVSGRRLQLHHSLMKANNDSCEWLFTHLGWRLYLSSALNRDEFLSTFRWNRWVRFSFDIWWALKLLIKVDATIPFTVCLLASVTTSTGLT